MTFGPTVRTGHDASWRTGSGVDPSSDRCRPLRGPPFLSGVSLYTNTSNFGSATLVVKPAKRVTAGLGYVITSTTGNTLILNPIAPTGPLDFNYHLNHGFAGIRDFTDGYFQDRVELRLQREV